MDSVDDSDNDPSAKSETLDVVQEELQVAKTASTIGRVRIRTITDEIDEMVEETLSKSQVHVDRVAIDREVDSPPPPRVEKGVLIVPVVEEVLVIEKRLRLKEELHIHSETTDETVEVPVTLRKQRAVVERHEPDEPETIPDQPETAKES